MTSLLKLPGGRAQKARGLVAGGSRRNAKQPAKALNAKVPAWSLPEEYGQREGRPLRVQQQSLPQAQPTLDSGWP